MPVFGQIARKSCREKIGYELDQRMQPRGRNHVTATMWSRNVVEGTRSLDLKQSEGIPGLGSSVEERDAGWIKTEMRKETQDGTEGLHALGVLVCEKVRVDAQRQDDLYGTLS